MPLITETKKGAAGLVRSQGADSTEGRDVMSRKREAALIGDLKKAKASLK